MAQDNIIYWIWLAEQLGQGSRLASKLVNLYKDPFCVYEKSLTELLETKGLTEGEYAVIRKSLGTRNLEAAQKIVKDCEDLKIRVITPNHPEYPKTLLTLSDMPLVLYCKGKIPDKQERLFISIVGTRNMSDYGRRVSYGLGYGIALGGAIIVSGMALGSDSMAMAGAMDAGAPTIAILGCGVDIIYPREHREMYYKIIANGAVISEYPPGSPPSGHHFPVRNRIISGISEGTVVVEGNASSGSLITARHAAKQGKKVFAVPGNVGEPGSEGTFNLLYEDALPCATAEDVLEEFSFLYPRTINVDYVHSKLRDVDFDKASLVAMERARIGVRGETQYYGTGVNGGRAKDFKRNSPPVKENIAEKAPTAAGTASSPMKRQESPVSVPKQTVDESPEKSKKTGISSIFGKLTQKNSEKNGSKETESKENKKKTTGFTLNMLDEIDIKVYNIMQPNVPTVPDSLVSDELDISVVLCALSTLEIAGVVESSPGGYFTRVGENLPTVLIDDEGADN